MLVLLPFPTYLNQSLGDMCSETIPLLCANRASDSISTLNWDGMTGDCANTKFQCRESPFFLWLAGSCPPPLSNCRMIGQRTSHSLILYSWVSSTAFLPLVLLFSSSLFCGLRLPRLFFLPQSRVLYAGSFLLVILLFELSIITLPLLLHAYSLASRLLSIPLPIISILPLRSCITAHLFSGCFRVLCANPISPHGDNHGRIYLKNSSASRRNH